MKAVAGLVSESTKLVQSLRTGPFGKGRDEKEQLAGKLKELEQNLQQVGTLAHVGEAYSRTNEEVLGLLQVCKRAQGFLRDNMQDLTHKSADGYRGSWQVVTTLFDTIGENLDVPKKAMLGVAQWYDADDSAKIDLRLNDFSLAYERASQAVRMCLAQDAGHELGAMIGPLADVQTLLENTIYEKVLRTLQTLAA